MKNQVKANKSILLEVKNLKKSFLVKNPGQEEKIIHALNGISFILYEGETLGLVGESGCGKSTAARTLLRLIEPTSGEIFYRNQNLLCFGRKKIRSLRKEIQIIFQDPFASLNPRKNIGKTLEEPFKIHGIDGSKKINERVISLLKRVGLSSDQKEKYPHELSGGQLQRIAIARAIALTPRLIIADEPVSALDVSIRAQIINLLSDLKVSMGISYLFISHDMALIKHFCDRVAVMYLGKIVELADSRFVYETPKHPYTEALLAAIPRFDPVLEKKPFEVKGDVPGALEIPKGCAFHTRCPIREKKCEEATPKLKEISPGHYVACFLRE